MAFPAHSEPIPGAIAGHDALCDILRRAVKLTNGYHPPCVDDDLRTKPPLCHCATAFYRGPIPITLPQRSVSKAGHNSLRK